MTVKPLRLVTVLAGLFAIYTPALAQTLSAPVPRHRDLATEIPASTGARNMGDYAIDQSNRQNLSARAQAALRNASPGRLSRAERVAQLINEGDCTGAYALAREQRDRRLAHRVAEVCEIEE